MNPEDVVEQIPAQSESANPTSGDGGLKADGDGDGEAVIDWKVEEWLFSALEALAFATPDPLSPQKAAELIGAEMSTMESTDNDEKPTLPSARDMKRAFRTLLERWDDSTRTIGHGFRLVEVDGGIAFRTAASNARYLKRLQVGKPQKLSRAALETLSVIAYRQPATKPQIEDIRGVDCAGAIKALLDKKLIRILGKADDIGRPLLYGTSKTFLDFFGLASLNDLPTLKELHELEQGVVEAPVVVDNAPPAMIMDLFNPDQVTAVSAETEQEGAEALDALERALGEAKTVAKRASSLVFGMKIDDEEKASAAHKAESSGRAESDNEEATKSDGNEES